MPIHIEQMSSDVSIFSGDMPLSPEQINKLVQIVLQQLDARDQDKRNQQQKTKLRAGAAPTMFLGEE